MTKKLFIPSKYCTDDENSQICDFLELRRKNNNKHFQGEVCVIHETKDGKREILPPIENHIVLTGRRWVMQSCMNQNFSDTIQQKDWVINWFGVGNGGALAATPSLPLDTADNTTDLTSPISIKPTGTPTSGVYTADGYKKTLYTTTDNLVEMTYSESRGEVMMLAQLNLSYADCPYDDTATTVAINELGLYASPTDLESETNFTLFSRYCRPTIYKTNGDAYLFLWYIYF